jgi:phosphoglycolate phosphatase
MKFRGILFDKDGTLIESDGTWIPLYRRMLMRLKRIDENAANQLLSLAGYDIANDRMIGGSVLAGGTTRQLVDIWWPDAPAEERESIRHDIDNTDKDAAETTVEPLVDLHQVFESLRATGMVLGIATNDSAISAKRHMLQLGVNHHFDVIIGSDSVAEPKPSGDMIRKFAEVTGLGLHEIIMVGDNHHDMEEARNGAAGYRVAVLSGNGDHEQLAHLADVTLSDIGELAQHLESLRVL